MDAKKYKNFEEPAEIDWNWIRNRSRLQSFTDKPGTDKLWDRDGMLG